MSFGFVIFIFGISIAGLICGTALFIVIYEKVTGRRFQWRGLCACCNCCDCCNFCACCVEPPSEEPEPVTNENQPVASISLRQVDYIPPAWKTSEEPEKELLDPSLACAICLDPLCNLKTSCEHSFHLKCLAEWTKKNRSCPICRQTVSYTHLTLPTKA